MTRSLFLLVFVLTTEISAQEISRRDIMRWQDERGPVDSLLVALESHESAIRNRAASALANLQDTMAAVALGARLSDDDPGVRRSAAFALGLTPSPYSDVMLFSRWTAENDRSVRIAMSEALGRTSTPSALDVLAQLLPSKKREDAREFSLAFLRFSLRGIHTPLAIAHAFDDLALDDDEIRWHSLYALWRSSPNESVDSGIIASERLLSHLAASRSSDVRMHLATLLGRSRTDVSARLLENMLRRELSAKRADWRVQVSVVRAAAGRAVSARHFVEHLLRYLSVENSHVRIALLQSLVQSAVLTAKDTQAVRVIRENFRQMLRTGTTEPMPVRAEAYVLLGRLGLADEFGTAPLLEDSTTDPWLRSRLLEAFAQLPLKRNMVLVMQYLNHDTSRIAAAAWESLKRLCVPPLVRSLSTDESFWPAFPARIAEAARASLERRDIALTASVAAFLGDSLVHATLASTAHEPILLSAMEEALARSESAVDVESMQALIAALGIWRDSSSIPLLEKLLKDPDRTVVAEAVRALELITGRSYAGSMPARGKPQHRDHDWTLLAGLSDKTRITVKTTKGEFILQLLPDDAPFTVVNFVRLVRRGFYDGLLFHRVVPNFVIQGGDPRGDGWGGPGYTIRTEVTMRGYERGSVGIASAGKDTEGCQFFVTHSATPHLDGRYTIFARVVKGMDVVDAIQINDRILSIRMTK